MPESLSSDVFSNLVGNNAATAPSTSACEENSKARAPSSNWGSRKREEILDYVRRNKADLTIEETAIKFSLSLATAGRYLSTLAGEGSLKRESVYSLNVQEKT